MTQPKPCQRGSALLLTLVFVALFASLAVALATTAEMSLLVGRNRISASQAEALVETGLLLVQRELSGLPMSGMTAETVHGEIAGHLASVWSGSDMVNTQDITYTADSVVVPAISLPVADGDSGTVTLVIASEGGVSAATTVTVKATGTYRDATQTAWYDLRIEEGGLQSTGLVCRGRVRVRHQALLQGVNSDEEGSILSASDAGPAEILLRESATVSGNAFVTNPDGEVRVNDDATILGALVVDATEPTWPTVNTAPFEAYVEQNFDGDTSGDLSLSNVRILAGTNPTFNGNVSIFGVLYIEAPNRVRFNGNASACAVIVAEPPAVEDLANNRVWFYGPVSAASVDNLPDTAEYQGIREQTGTFVLAPGSDVRFKDTFNTLPGCLVVGRLRMITNASGTVRGWIAGLVDETNVIKDNSVVMMDLSAVSDSPAGVSGGYKLVCVPESYRE